MWLWITYGVLCGLAGAGLILLLVSPRRGAPIALMDGVALTLNRTAAASALAARFLARPDARRLAMVGAGALAPYLIAAHAETCDHGL